jgi:GNAT superfamily N-acetyltransferase
VKDLQKQNFLEILQCMHSLPGWDILKTGNFLGLKSPARFPLVNFVWGDVTLENFKAAQSFFGNHSYVWVISPEQKGQDLLDFGFGKPIASVEMLLCLEAYVGPKSSPQINIITPTLHSEIQQWVETAAEIFKLSKEGVQEFFLPLIQTAGLIPFLALYDGKPAATSLVFCGKEVAGVYAMGTLKPFRRKGLGSAALHACLQAAKSKNLKYSVLYSSSMGKSLYKKVGFQTTNLLQEYSMTRRS